MDLLRVVIIGGYGYFGSRLAERLSRQAGLHIVVAGRSLPSAEALSARLATQSQSPLTGAAIDLQRRGFAAALAPLRPQVVVHAAGPFQVQDYRVAEAALACGAHYIDIADGRAFVSGIVRLHQAAQAADLMVTSGASSVPALSCAAADRLAEGLVEVSAIDIGISPGNRTERGLSTMQSVLSYCGEPLPLAGGQRVFGWSGSRRHRYSDPVGLRLLSPCDVPDLTLLPTRYPGRPAIRFGAGLELPLLHRGMNVMAAARRSGLVRNWAGRAGLLKRIADRLKHRGTDAGAMHVAVEGIDAKGAAVHRTWELVATEGHGPYVPTLAAAALVRKLASGTVPATGATPCLGLLDLKDFEGEALGLHIRMGALP